MPRVPRGDVPLTPTQQAAADAFLSGKSRIAACEGAGVVLGAAYKTKRNRASEYFKLPKMVAYIERRRAKAAERAEISIERVLREYARLAFSDMGDLMEWGPDGVKFKDGTKLTPDQRAAIAEVSETISKEGGSRRLKTHDKKGALDSIAKHLGMFVEKHEHTGPGGEAIPVAIIERRIVKPDSRN